MSEKKHIFYVDAIVSTPVKIQVKANDEQDAFARLMDGAWHSCDAEPKTWDNATITHVGPMTKGPGIN